MMKSQLHAAKVDGMFQWLCRQITDIITSITEIYILPIGRYLTQYNSLLYKEMHAPE